MNPSSIPNRHDLRRAWLHLSRAAWLCLAIHLLAGIAMATILRQGLATNPDLVARLRFIADHRTLWTGAWLTWNAAALAILYFYACFVRAHELDGRSREGPLKFAVMLTIAAVAADLSAEGIQMGVLPGLASDALAELDEGSSSPAVQLFATLDRITVVMTGYLANGLYTLSALLLVLSTRAAYRQWVWMAGVAVGLSGIALSVASLVDSVSGMVWSNAVLVPSVIVWQIGVAVTAARRGGGASDPA